MVCTGLYGKDNEEGLRADEVIQILTDIRTTPHTVRAEEQPVMNVNGP